MARVLPQEKLAPELAKSVAPRHLLRYWREGVSFVKAELEAGLACSMIALSSYDRETIARNTANARAAFDVALRSVRKVGLTFEDSKEINQGFEKLKENLVRLGQGFQDS